MRVDEHKPRCGKRIRKMKNLPKTGKSMRRGNAPSPYTKYHKAPYIYSFKRKNYKIEEEKRVAQRKAA